MSYPVFIHAKIGSTDLDYPRATIPAYQDAEAWAEQIITAPSTGVMTVGLTWNLSMAVNEAMFLNEMEILKLNSTTTPEYQYNLKDHLGNVRMTFTAKRDVDTGTATMETANASAETAKFLYYDEAVKINSVIFDHTNAGTTYYSTRLNGSSNERTGLARSLSVMPGDTINAQVYAKYLDTNNSNWTTALTNFMASIANNTAPAGTFIDGGSPGSTGGVTAPWQSAVSKASETGTAPKAYLNYLVFDRDYNLLDGGFIRVTTAAREYGQDGAHDLLQKQVIATQPGYVYFYLSNDNYALGGAQVEVYFDDFKVEQVKSPVVQSQDYYPFGLTFNSFNRENSLSNYYQYNGKEKQDELNLGWLDYGMRMLEPTIGRWVVEDSRAEKYFNMTPFNYVGNNPLLFVDHKGDSISLNEVDKGGYAGFQEIVSKGSGGFYQADIDLNNGLVSIVPTGQQGTITPDQQKFVDQMQLVTNQPGVTKVNVSNNSKNVLIGDIKNNTIDVGDMLNLGTNGKINAQKTLVHEMVENNEVQLKGQTTTIAHMRGANAENKIGPVMLDPIKRFVTPSATIKGLGTLTIPVIGPPKQKGSVSVTVFDNNVIGVAGNKVSSITNPKP